MGALSEKAQQVCFLFDLTDSLLMMMFFADETKFSKARAKFHIPSIVRTLLTTSKSFGGATSPIVRVMPS